ncbi:hypothetical protein [Reyranella sp.]|uniref:hypothetical protein n=1 Tax=Reyranella sp. TaxID=1929291 RepID=UPI003783F78B
MPGKRWQVVLYLDNNSGKFVVPMINCRFTDAGELVEQTHASVPPERVARFGRAIFSSDRLVRNWRRR